MSLPAIHFPQQREPYFPYSAKIILKPSDKFNDEPINDEPINILKFIVSEDEYWCHYYECSDIAYEWNNGYLEEKPVSDHATFLIYHWFVNVLSMFLHTHPIATCSGLEMGFRLNKTIRKPDFGVVLNNNSVTMLKSDRRYHGIFDLCVEALSDSNKHEKERDTIIKKAEYASIGVKEYFILHDSEERAFYRLNAKGDYVPIRQRQKGVICSDVLPGFQFRISDLSKRPSIEEMLEDPVYKGFVFPAWQLEKERAQEAEQRAQTEATLHLEADQRAQTEAALRLEAEQRAQTEATLRFEAEQRAQEAEQRVQIEATLRLEAHAEIARLKALLLAQT